MKKYQKFVIEIETEDSESDYSCQELLNIIGEQIQRYRGNLNSVEEFD